MSARHIEFQTFGLNSGPTTIGLEPYFWTRFEEIAEYTEKAAIDLLNEIDPLRLGSDWSPAIRSYIAEFFWRLAVKNGALTEPGHDVRGDLRSLVSSTIEVCQVEIDPDATITRPN